MRLCILRGRQGLKWGESIIYTPARMRRMQKLCRQRQLQALGKRQAAGVFLSLIKSCAKTVPTESQHHACRFEHELSGGPWQYQCYPALVGEGWYDDYVRYLLQGPCKDGCSHIKVMIFSGIAMSDRAMPAAMSCADIVRMSCEIWLSCGLQGIRGLS